MGAQEEVGQPPRVVLDTNVVVSALVFRGGRLVWLREAWTHKRIKPLLSRDTLMELVRVLTYPKFGFDAEDTKSALAHYLEHAEMVSRIATRAKMPACRDPDDRKFLVLAYAAQAAAIVTGDRDLLALAATSRIPILTPEALHQRLAGG